MITINTIRYAPLSQLFYMSGSADNDNNLDELIILLNNYIFLGNAQLKQVHNNKFQWVLYDEINSNIVDGDIIKVVAKHMNHVVNVIQDTVSSSIHFKDAHAVINKTHYISNSSTLLLRGWCISSMPVDSVAVYHEDGIYLGDATLRLPSPEVKDLFPEYNDVNAGWQFLKQINYTLNSGDSILVQYYSNEGCIAENKIELLEGENIDISTGNIENIAYIPEYDRLVVNGYMLSPGENNCIELVNNKGETIANALANRPNPESFKRHPEYSNENSGWKIDTRLYNRLSENDILTLRLVENNKNTILAQKKLLAENHFFNPGQGEIVNIFYYPFAKRLVVTGWFISLEACNTVEIWLNEKLLGTTTLILTRHGRPNVYQHDEKRPTDWYFQISLLEPPEKASEIKAVLTDNEQVHASTSFHISDIQKFLTASGGDNYLLLKAPFKHLKQISELHKKEVNQKVRRHRLDKHGPRVLAIYDCTDIPLSFDILGFLLSTEVYRRKKNCEKIDLVFLCHAVDPSPNRHNYINSTNFRHRLHNIMFEATRLLPSIGNIQFFDNRTAFEEFFRTSHDRYHLYPADYDPENPQEIHRLDRSASHTLINGIAEMVNEEEFLALRAPDEQLRVVRKWMRRYIHDSAIPVSITLREWDDWATLRNSLIPEWQKLIDYYEDSPLRFIILRDFSKLYEDDILTGKNVLYFNEAMHQLSLRAALYEECTINLLINVGGAGLAVYNRHCNYLLFKPVVDDRGSRFTDHLQHGHFLGTDHAGATRFQHYVWEEDTFDNLHKHLENMLEKLIANGLISQFNKSKK